MTYWNYVTEAFPPNGGVTFAEMRFEKLGNLTRQVPPTRLTIKLLPERARTPAPLHSFIVSTKGGG